MQYFLNKIFRIFIETNCCKRLHISIPTDTFGYFNYIQNLNNRPAYQEYGTFDAQYLFFVTDAAMEKDRWVISKSLIEGNSEVYGRAWNIDASVCPENLQNDWQAQHNGNIIENFGGVELQCTGKITKSLSVFLEGK